MTIYIRKMFSLFIPFTIYTNVVYIKVDSTSFMEKLKYVIIRNEGSIEEQKFLPPFLTPLSVTPYSSFITHFDPSHSHVLVRHL